MKFRDLFYKNKAFSLGLLLSVMVLQNIFAQTTIMPIGNSITYGVINGQDPPAGQYGYRQTLYDKLNNDASISETIEFVGDNDAATNYDAWYKKGAHIYEFLYDTAYGDISVELSLHNPDIVLLHLGTNDIGLNKLVGDYLTQGTLMNEMYTLVSRIVSHASVDHIFICKVIPKLNTPGNAQNTREFNNAIEIMLSESDLSGNPKINVVDMHTPFEINQTTWLSTDRIHPTLTGYSNMAEIFYQYLRPKFVDEVVENFNDGILDGWGPSNDDGQVGLGIEIIDIDNDGTGALHFSSSNNYSTQWSHLAVWRNSENFSSIEVTIHDSTKTGQLYGFGTCVGLDAADTTANGYMIFRHPSNGTYQLYTLLNGRAASFVASVSAPAYTPGSTYNILFKQGPGTDANIITLFINGAEYTLVDDNPVVGKSDTYYSGILFNGRNASQVYIDEFTVKSQLPDNIPPAAPYNVDFGGVTNTSALVSWTAPGNDGYASGPASTYDMRFSTSPINTSGDFANASLVTGLDEPGSPGSSEQFEITGLNPGTIYYVRLKAVDSWGNTSGMSEMISFRTNLSNLVEVSFDYPIISDADTTRFEDEWWYNDQQYEIVEIPAINDNELANIPNATTAWSNTAIYTRRTNPSIIKMVFGANATEDGVGHAALTCMINTPDQTARGYMIWIHNTSTPPKVRLYEFRSAGSVTGATDLDFKPYALDAMPGPGDTLSVTIDWDNAQGIKFDVYVNSDRAINGSLWDENRLYNPENKYAGIMLNNNFAGQHNITSFIISAEPDVPTDIRVVSQPDSAEVASIPDENIRIRILDASGSPASDVPVWFDAESPADAAIADPDNVELFDPVHIEAEWDVTPEGTYGMIQDNNASGGEYMVAYVGDASLDYTFHIKKDTTYYVWARIWAPGWSQMTTGIQIDNNASWTFDGYAPGDLTGWKWKPVNDRGHTGEYTPVSLRLTEGSHTLKITKLHNNVPIDKIVITSDKFSGSWIDDAQVTPLFSDANGYAEVPVQLGTIAGPNIFKAYAMNIQNPATVTVIGTNTDADSIAKTVYTDNQTGAARDTSDIPIEVTVLDEYGNAVSGVNVRFATVKGDAAPLTPNVVSNSIGKASTFIKFGEQDSIHNIIAYLPQYPLVEADTFTVYTVTGRVNDVIGLPGNYAGEKIYVNSVLDSFLVARVKNDKGNGVSNTPVTFRVVQGNARVGKQPKYTNANGIASDTLWIGAKSSIIKVIADAGLAKDTIVVDSTFYRATVMQYISGDKSKVKVGEVLTNKIKVRVYNNKDPYNQEFAKNFPVLFRITDTRYGFKFSNNADTITVKTNPSTGTATANVIPGPIHGQYNDIIEAVATDGFYPIDIQGFDGKFTVFVRSNAQALDIVSGKDIEGVVNSEVEDSLIVRMWYPDPVTGEQIGVPNQPVHFTRLSSNGYFTGYTFADAQVTILTDDDGYAWVQYTLGSKAGTYSDSVRVEATDGESALINSGYIFRMSATSTGADSIAAFSNSHVEGVAGRAVKTKIEVQVLDHFGNGVPGEKVTYRVIKGGGFLNGNVDTVKSAISQGAGGIAEIYWTVGTKAGASNNELEAFATNGIDTLRGSPVKFTASVIADSVSPTRSVIATDTTRYKANGQDTCWVTVTLYDQYGNPVSGKSVELQLSGGGFEHDPVEPTDSLGRTMGYLVSTTSGEKTVRAKNKTDNMILDDQTRVIFESDVASQLVSLSNDRPAGNVGTVLKDPLVVKVVDGNNNPVANKSVTFSIVGEHGKIVEPQPLLSDSLGLVQAHLQLGDEEEQVVVSVSSTSLIGDVVYFIAEAHNNPATAMGYADDNNIIEGPAGQVLDEPFRVLVIDDENDPVANVNVEFTLESGVGEIVSVDSSDAYGHAKAYFRAGSTVDGTRSEIKATSALAGSPLYFFVTSVAGTPDKLIPISNQQQERLIDENILLRVLVADEFDNPVPGVDVRYEVVKGNAAIQGNATVQSDEDGEAIVAVNVGTKAGEVEIWAINATLNESPVKFKINVSTSSNMAHRIKMYPEPVSGDTTYMCAVNSYLPDSLYIQVVDEYDNPVKSKAVWFRVESGDGQLVGSKLVPSRKNGIAAHQFKGASTPGMTVVRASWDAGENVVYFNIQTVNNPRNPILKKGPPYFDYVNNIDESNQANYLQAALVADNADPGESFLFQVYDANGALPQQKPNGLSVQQQSGNTANMEWVPNYEQAGKYKLVLRVADGQGGFDADTVTVNVANVDRPPKIHAHYISKGDTTVVAGEAVLHFWVDARDPDGDAITYQWYIDSQRQPSTTSEMIYEVDSHFAGSQTVTVFAISGPLSATSYKWTLSVQPYVKLSEMIAAFDKYSKKVMLTWKTSHEVNHSGFHVYRSRTEFGDYHKISGSLVKKDKDGNYHFEDQNVKAGATYFYKLVDEDNKGQKHEHGPLVVHIPVPKDLILTQNYPNPFNPSTRIRFEVPKQENIELHIYNMLGQHVVTLVNEVKDAGYYEVVWNGKNEAGVDVATGVYLYRIQSQTKSFTKRMVKIK